VSKLTKENLETLTRKDSSNGKKFWKETSQWSGNSDDMGSVDSGWLEENICFECGNNTMGDLNDSENPLFMCDKCDGEYHFKCTNLDRIPRKNSGFVCKRCVEEEQYFERYKYNVEGFEIHKRRGAKLVICYSPSKPLDKAWKECQEKGFMVVSKVFDYETMIKLTHGTLTRTTSSGRVADTWTGALTEIAKRLKASCHNIIIRGGRYDLKLPEFVVKELKLNEILEPILDKLRTIMGIPKPEMRTHNVVFAPVNSECQKWHFDDSKREGKYHRYFTILIHLNTLDADCGGTEIWSGKGNVHRGDLIRARPGDAFVFNGSLMHRGRENIGGMHRLFYYASFACREDANTLDYK